MAEEFYLEGDGISIAVIEYGARLTRCLVADARGVYADVAPGLEDESAYRSRGGSMGAILGRYGNRIENGRIELDSRSFELSRNDSGLHTMHGGAENFGMRRWTGALISKQELRLSLVSEDGDQGWPGRVEAEVVYRLTGKSLSIELSAVSNRRTFLNLIFHGYWNLAGHQSPTVGEHLLRVAADHYLPVGPSGVPTGKLAAVEGSPFDFRAGRRIGDLIGETGSGYNHNLCLREPGLVRPVARLLDVASGRAMELATDQPGLQLFTANGWTGIEGKDGANYRAHSAVALETQLYPNTPNTPSFHPRPLEAGERYSHTMTFAFCSVEQDEIDAFIKAPWKHLKD